MLSKTALAAVAALSFLFTTSAAPNLAFAAQKDSKHATSKKSSKKASNKSSKKVVHKKVVNKKVVNKKVVHKDVVVRGGGGYVARSTAATTAFVVMGSPVAYRAYGAGWCRALHRGRHWAPGAGWHAGKHVGRVKC